MPSRVSVVSERLPIARWVLKVLRDKNSGIGDFRDFMRLAGIILAIETSRELEWKHAIVETPLNVRV
ncbi:MAG: uracil phosphoribosyltransferase, partial [Acidilobaceae archaeon]